MLGNNNPYSPTVKGHLRLESHKNHGRSYSLTKVLNCLSIAVLAFGACAVAGIWYYYRDGGWSALLPYFFALIAGGACLAVSVLLAIIATILDRCSALMLLIQAPAIVFYLRFLPWG